MVDEENQVSEDQLSDDDLDKIMKEIVAEEVVSKEETVQPKEATQAITNVVSQEAAPAPAASTTTAQAVTPIRVMNSSGTTSTTTSKSSSPSGGQSLRLEFTGPIQLKLEFTTNGKSIELNCTNDALICRMADGTEFKIPTTSVATGRKAA